MSDEIKPEVEIRADGATESLGNSAYYAVKGDFSPQGYRVSLTVMLGLVVLIFVGMFFSRKPTASGPSGRGLPAPGVARDNSGINPKLLTEKDLTNIIRRPKMESSLLGKIKVVSLRSVSALPIGSEMRAVLASGATDGIVKARLTAPLIVDGEPLLPENAVLFGRGKSGDERLFVEFTKVIFPGGEGFPIRAQAFDAGDKIQGLKGALVGTRTKKMAGAIGFGFLGGMADGMQETSGSYFSTKKPSTRDAALSGASKAALDQSEAYLEEMKKSPNIIEVKTGTEIIVITDEPKEKRKGFYEEE
jgi:hypothetical protein